MLSSARQYCALFQRADVGIGPYMGFQLVREHPTAPLCKGWCSAQRIKITMTAGGSHTTMYCWQKSLIFD